MNDASTKRKHDDDRPAPHDAANTGDGKSRGGQLADTLVESSRVQGAFGNATSIPMAPSPIVKRAFIATESPAGSPMKDIETAVPASIKKPCEYCIFPTNLFGRPSASNLTTWDDTEEINVLPVKKPNETAATTMQTANYTRPLPVFGSTSSFGSATSGTPVFGSTTTTSSISFASLASAAAKKNLDQPPEKPKDGNNVGGTATSAEKNPFGSSAFGDAGRSNLQFQSFGRGFGNFENGKSSENSSETAFKESEKDSKTEANDEKAASDKEEKTNTPEALKQVSADSIKKFTFGGALGGRETESISSGDSLKLNSIVKPASFSGTERAFGSTSSVSMSFGATSTSKSTFEELLKSSSTVGERAIKTAKQTDDDDNENDENDDENALNYEVAIEKKVEIPEIEVKTGEEDESNIFYVSNFILEFFLTDL
ncbi:hypothetical protein HDU84_001297 [Entophlyctis sp. JEL0112]|nr:hypothetical protein HDU84_001297 [Entophlyctis sp. JEL0112]